MKKSVLAVAIAAAAFAASAASAAQVYDKDGTSLAVGGMVEVMAGNANGYFGNGSDDASTRDRFRINMNGRTQVTDGIAVYGFFELEQAHKGSSEEATGVNGRYAYVGADFGKFGKVQFGRYEDPFEYASQVVDLLDEVGIYGGMDERNSGHLSYMWSGYGFDAGVSYQFATDAYRDDEFSGKYNVDSGFSIYAGYTTPSVLFGPISIRAGYLYLNGQAKDDGAQRTTITGYDLSSAVNDEDGRFGAFGTLNNVKAIAAGLAWGTNGKGLYLATAYHYAKYTFSDVVEGEFDDDGKLKSSSDGAKDKHVMAGLDYKAKAWESVVTYGFDNGVRIGASYHWLKRSYQDTGVADCGKTAGKAKWFELLADYNVTPNFKVWAEAAIDAGTDVGYGYKVTNSASNDAIAYGDYKKAHNAVMVGAKYTF